MKLEQKGLTLKEIEQATQLSSNCLPLVNQVNAIDTTPPRQMNDYHSSSGAEHLPGMKFDPVQGGTTTTAGATQPITSRAGGLTDPSYPRVDHTFTG